MKMKLNRAVALLPALAVVVVLALSVPARAEDVTLYAGRYFNGDRKSLNSNWNGRSDWGARTRSIRVPEGYKVTVYSEQDYRGRSKVITGDWSISSGDYWSGRVRSVRYERTGSSGSTWWDRSYPALFSGTRWNGQSMTLKSTWNGRYGLNSARSIRIPRGWIVTVYSEDDYRGRSIRLSGDWSANHSGGWRYAVRSARAERTDGFGGSGGSWQDGSSWDGRTTVYSDPSFRGARKTLTGNWPGDSTWDGSPYAIRSIRVRRGETITGYSAPRYQGSRIVISGDWSPSRSDSWSGRIRSIRFDGGSGFGGSGGSGGFGGSGTSSAPSTWTPGSTRPRPEPRTTTPANNLKPTQPAKPEKPAKPAPRTPMGR